DHPLGEVAVIDSRGQIIARRRRAERQPDREVDQKILTGTTFFLEHAMESMDAQALETDPVLSHGPILSLSGPPFQAATTSRARRVIATSCTRTPQAPA